MCVICENDEDSWVADNEIQVRHSEKWKRLWTAQHYIDSL